mmetsp:Transcript_46039/g.127989  ORF Transcript_46039/g.127989 Transcript_46039/m.127989 type:complete len:125 (-) Transcript_46039:1467-1841(-)
MNDTCQVQLSGPVASLSFSPDKVEVIAGTSTGFVYRLRMDNLQSLLVCENHAAAVKRISFAPDASDRFATLSSDCTIRVWYDGLGSGSEVNPHPHSHPVLALTLALALALTYIHILHHAPTPTP